MPQMSPMSWMLLSLLFMMIISNLKSMMNMGQKNESQKSSSKTPTQNSMKW